MATLASRYPVVRHKEEIRMRSFVHLLFILSIPVLALGQNTPARVNDPQALSYAALSINALTGGTAITDATLTGTVTWIAGSDKETGTATLWASGQRESRVEFALSGGSRIEIRDAQTGVTKGKWIAPNDKAGKFSFHNCQTDAVWFFPPLSSLAPSPTLALSYAGQETYKGKSAYHLHSYVRQSTQHLTRWVKELSAMDFYLDATTMRPLAVMFNIHPDNNARSNVPVEVDYSDYRSISGVLVPTHIKKYVQGTLLIDLSISAAEFNTGIALSTFSMN